MDNPARDAATMFADEFLTGEGNKTLVKMKIRVMLMDHTTDPELLADALMKIVRAFPNDDVLIVEGVDRLYSEFLKRK